METPILQGVIRKRQGAIDTSYFWGERDTRGKLFTTTSYATDDCRPVRTVQADYSTLLLSPI